MGLMLQRFALVFVLVVTALASHRFVPSSVGFVQRVIITVIIGIIVLWTTSKGLKMFAARDAKSAAKRAAKRHS